MYFITGMLCWWMEPPALLAEAVSSVNGLCDRLIAYDGGFALVDDATAESPLDQYQAIEENFDGPVIFVSQLWDGQVQKRNALLQHAARDSEYVMILDADWKVSGNYDIALAQLRESEAEAFTIRMWTPLHPDKDVLETSAHQWHAEVADQEQRLEVLYRSMQDMRVIAHHWFFSGVRPDGTRVALWGGDGIPPTKQPLDDLLITHLCHQRELYDGDGSTIRRNLVFCARRDTQVKLTGKEA